MKRKGVSLPLTVVVMTDYTCIPFWEETDCDYYIVPHEEASGYLCEKGDSRGEASSFWNPCKPQVQNES